MTDEIIINQVNLVFITKYYNCPPERVIRLREQGSSFGNIERKIYRETEFQARTGRPSKATRSSITPTQETRDPQKWREIPSQGVRPPSSGFKDVYPTISHPSQRPEVKNRYSKETKGQGHDQGKKDKRGKD